MNGPFSFRWSNREVLLPRWAQYNHGWWFQFWLWGAQDKLWASISYATSRWNFKFWTNRKIFFESDAKLSLGACSSGIWTKWIPKSWRDSDMPLVSLLIFLLISTLTDSNRFVTCRMMSSMAKILNEGNVKFSSHIMDFANSNIREDLMRKVGKEHSSK